MPTRQKGCNLLAVETYNEIRRAARDGVLEAIPDIVIALQGHPADEAEKLLADDEEEAA
jgi:hypothetical protein